MKMKLQIVEKLKNLSEWRDFYPQNLLHWPFLLSWIKRRHLGLDINYIQIVWNMPEMACVKSTVPIRQWNSSQILQTHSHPSSLAWIHPKYWLMLGGCTHMAWYVMLTLKDGVPHLGTNSMLIDAVIN